MPNKRRRLVSLIICVIILACSLSFVGCAEQKDNHLYRQSYEDFSVHYLNVGQGDCIFMQFPDKKTMLIDCAEKDQKLSEFIVKFIQKLSVNKIDYFVLTHPDTDHVGNAKDIIENFDIGSIYTPDIIESKLALFPIYFELLQRAKEKGIQFKTSHFYNSIIGKNYALGFLSPSPKSMLDSSYTDFNSALEPTASQVNALSPIIYLEVFGKRFLFTGDAPKSQEELVMQNINLGIYDHTLNMQVNLENLDYLKVAHHGGEDSCSLDFLNMLKPKNAIISVSGANYYGHPSDIVLERLQIVNEDIDILRTDYDGTISVLVDKNGNAEVLTDKQLNNE